MKFQAKRSIVINADLEKVKKVVADFNTWATWSPWSMVEPNHKSSIKGTPGQVGHEMTWDGKVIGSGINKIESVEENQINYDLVFLKPYKSKSKTSFKFEKASGGTKVTWTMDSSMPFFMFFMIKKMKAWIEMDYDRGLTMLKAVIEKGSVAAKTTNEGVEKFNGFKYVGVQKTSKMGQMPEEMTACFEQLMAELKKNEKWAKHWVTLYPKFDMVKRTFTYIVAASAEELEGIEFSDKFVTGEIESGKILNIKHKGSYMFLGNAWSMGMMYLRSKKMKQRNIPFEYYWNSPYDTEESQLETSIYFPVK